MPQEIGFGKITGLDNSAEAIRCCAEKGPGTVRRGNVTNMALADEALSLVLATDIIALWGFQDEVSLHKYATQLGKISCAEMRDSGLGEPL